MEDNYLTIPTSKGFLLTIACDTSMNLPSIIPTKIPTKEKNYELI